MLGNGRLEHELTWKTAILVVANEGHNWMMVVMRQGFGRLKSSVEDGLGRQVRVEPIGGDLENSRKNHEVRECPSQDAC